MIARISVAGLCLLIVCLPAQVRAQTDAQDRTQSLLDTHKDMDPTSPDRALTTKTRRPETRIETSPLPPPPQKETMEKQKTLKRIRQLQQQKKDFIKKRMQPENEKAAGAEKFAARDATRMKKDANDAWERTDQAQILRKLEEQERKRPKTSAKAEAKISTAPLPPRSY